MIGRCVLFIVYALLAGSAFAKAPTLIVDRIDTAAITEGLPLMNREATKSDGGKKKVVWDIKGAELGRFEVIGNSQKDADTVAWQCSSYDKSGNSVPPVKADSYCHKLFVKVLSKITSTPEFFSKALISEAAASKATAIRTLDDFSIETDGKYFFIRRISRMTPN